MSLVCRTLVLIENVEILRVVVEAFPHPKYELEFVDSPDDAAAHAFTNRIDLFVVDSKFASDKEVISIRHNLPTLILKPECVHDNTEGFDAYEEAGRIRSSAQKLLRKNYINWIVDALEYSG